MDFYWIKTSRLIKFLFRKYVWDVPNNTNTVYLTFDDGPVPEATPWVLDLLKQHNIKATFFCIGNNIDKNPELFAQILADGHAIGNHTYHHRNGWNTKDADYLENSKMCEEAVARHNGGRLSLFRPPYGKITPSQATKLRRKGYRIIMWDILTADYDRNLSAQQVLQNATQKTASGSVIVFHDSLKAFPNVEYALPETIRILKERGFNFGVLA